MSLSRQQLASLGESAFVRSVLIPLLSAMGFEEVREYHGGILEQGKDVVMWKFDDFGVRVNYAVVAKAVRISGQASGKGSAAEVFVQATQALNSTFVDKRTGASECVDHCVVATNQEITKEASESIRNMLGASLAPRVSPFLDGKAIWDLLQKHSPRRTAIQQLRDVQNVLDSASEVFKVSADTKGPGVKLTISLREGVAPSLGVVKGKITIPKDTEDGKKAIEALQRHIATGAPATLTGASLQLSWPQEIAELIGASCTDQPTILLGARQSRTPGVVRVRLACPDGSQHVAGVFDFLATQVGTEEATIVARSALSPWTWTLTFLFKTKQVNVEWSYDLRGHAISLALEAVRFTRQLRLGGRLEVVDARSGLLVGAFELPAGGAPEVDPEWIELLARAEMIQRAVGVPLSIPSVALTEADAAEVNRAYRIIAEGAESARVEAVDAVFETLQADELVRALESGGPLAFQIPASGKREVLGVALDLGPCVATLTGMRLSRETLDRVKAIVLNGASAKGVPFRLEAADDGDNAILRFPRWGLADAGSSEQGADTRPSG